MFSPAGLDHLNEAPQSHVFDSNVVAVRHDVLEWLQEVLLELETGKFLDLHKAHRKLPKRVKGEEYNCCIIVTAYTVEVLTKYNPDISPFEAYSSHVIVTDLDKLLKTVCPR